MGSENLRLFSLQRSKIRLDAIILVAFCFDIVVNASKFLGNSANVNSVRKWSLPSAENQ